MSFNLELSKMGHFEQKIHLQDGFLYNRYYSTEFKFARQ